MKPERRPGKCWSTWAWKDSHLKRVPRAGYGCRKHDRPATGRPMDDPIRPPETEAANGGRLRELLAKHILPTLGHLTVAGLARADVTALHVSMKDTPRRANYTARTIQGMMTYACDNGLRPPLDNPVRKMKLFREGRVNGSFPNTRSGRPPTRSRPPHETGSSVHTLLPVCGWRCSRAPDPAKSPPSNGVTLTGSAGSFGCRLENERAQDHPPLGRSD